MLQSLHSVVLAVGRLVPARRARRKEAGRAAAEDAAVRLEGLGELARLAAHDVRNSLSVLYSSLEFLSRSADEEVLGALREETDRLLAIAESLARAARSEPLRRRPTRLTRVLTAARRRARAQGASTTRPVLGLAGVRTAPRVNVDAPRLADGLAHVLWIAASAGVRRVHASAEIPRRDVRLLLDLEGGSLDVEQLASAAPEEQDPGELGGALSLAIAQRVVREHEGRLHVEGGGEGTARFVIDLPRAE